MRRHLVFTALILALPLAFGCASKKPWSGGGGMKPANKQNHRFDPRFHKPLLNGLLYPPQGNPGAGAVGIRRPGGQPPGNPNLKIQPPSGAPPKQGVTSGADKKENDDKEKESAKKKKEGPTDTEEVAKKDSEEESEKDDDKSSEKTVARRRSSENATH